MVKKKPKRLNKYVLSYVAAVMHLIRYEGNSISFYQVELVMCGDFLVIEQTATYPAFNQLAQHLVATLLFSYWSSNKDVKNTNYIVFIVWPHWD